MSSFLLVGMFDSVSLFGSIFFKQAAEEVEEPNQNPHVEFSAGIIDEDMMEEETESEGECVQIFLRKGASSSSLPVEQMMELEAELEAELEQLTGQFSDDVVDKVRVESDDNDDSASEVPFMNNNYAVSPRELTRLLCKLQVNLMMNFGYLGTHMIMHSVVVEQFSCKTNFGSYLGLLLDLS